MTKHHWIQWGYDEIVCKHCNSHVYQQGWTVTTEHCEEFEEEKARMTRTLDTASLYVVMRLRDSRREYLDRDNHFGLFDDARFYQTKSPATAAKNYLVKYYRHNAEELSVLQINVTEPR